MGEKWLTSGRARIKALQKRGGTRGGGTFAANAKARAVLTERSSGVMTTTKSSSNREPKYRSGTFRGSYSAYADPILRRAVVGQRPEAAEDGHPIHPGRRRRIRDARATIVSHYNPNYGKPTQETYGHYSFRRDPDGCYKRVEPQWGHGSGDAFREGGVFPVHRQEHEQSLPQNSFRGNRQIMVYEGDALYAHLNEKQHLNHPHGPLSRGNHMNHRQVTPSSWQDISHKSDGFRSNNVDVGAGILSGTPLSRTLPIQRSLHGDLGHPNQLEAHSQGFHKEKQDFYNGFGDNLPGQHTGYHDHHTTQSFDDYDILAGIPSSPPTTTYQAPQSNTHRLPPVQPKPRCMASNHSEEEYPFLDGEPVEPFFENGVTFLDETVEQFDETFVDDQFPAALPDPRGDFQPSFQPDRSMANHHLLFHQNPNPGNKQVEKVDGDLCDHDVNLFPPNKATVDSSLCNSFGDDFIEPEPPDANEPIPRTISLAPTKGMARFQERSDHATLAGHAVPSARDDREPKLQRRPSLHQDNCKLQKYERPPSNQEEENEDPRNEIVREFQAWKENPKIRFFNEKVEVDADNKPLVELESPGFQDELNLLGKKSFWE